MDSFSWSEDREWLVANGLGGYASSTLTGLNTSKYHGLLIAAFSPEDRRVLLSKIDEEVQIGEDAYPLSANQYCDTVEPDGFKYLKTFSSDPHPCFTYEVPGARIEKRVFMPRGENAVVIRYSIKPGSLKKLGFSANFLTTSRDHHWVLDEPWWDFKFSSSGGVVTLVPGHENPPAICIGSTLGELSKPECGDNRLRGMYYRKDDACGQPCVDDLFIGARLELSIRADRKFYVVCAAGASEKEAESLCRRLLQEPFVVEDNEKHRRDGLFAKYCKLNGVTPFKGLEELVASSEDFLVKKGNNTAVIAGYPWFGEWGRDSLISLPGLCLTTGKKAEAEGILANLLAASEKGLIPNNFAGRNFNSLDASLWMFWAVWKYLEHTKDYGFVEKALWKTMKAVAQAYASMADSDGLIKSVSERPMTWMDTVVDEVPVTLRKGKAVEIQALWHNAMCVMAALAKKFGEKSEIYDNAARKCKKSFNEQFWNKETGYLFDCIDGPRKDGSVRPNALFAVSLGFPVLEESKWKGVVIVAEKELLTPFGLRTLARSEPGYKGTAGGNQLERDFAYHQGDAWPWLLGAFTDAYKRAHPHKDVTHFVKPLVTGENRSAIGKTPELYGGDAPHKPGGCISQAWGVAELMRAIAENPSTS